MDKLNFLLTKFPSLLRTLNPETKPVWGKMNVQQMVEHMIDSVRQGNGKLKYDVVTPVEHLSKYKEFLMTEKEFRPNTKNALMGEEPEPVKHSSLSEAITELESEIKDFVKKFENDNQAVITNPIFGDLNFEEWVQLFYKHAVHHLKQFGVEV